MDMFLDPVLSSDLPQVDNDPAQGAGLWHLDKGEGPEENF